MKLFYSFLLIGFSFGAFAQEYVNPFKNKQLINAQTPLYPMVLTLQ